MAITIDDAPSPRYFHTKPRMARHAAYGLRSIASIEGRAARAAAARRKRLSNMRDASLAYGFTHFAAAAPSFRQMRLLLVRIRDTPSRFVTTPRRVVRKNLKSVSPSIRTAAAKYELS